MCYCQWFYPFALPSASSALANISLALEQGCAVTLLKALQSLALGLRGLQTQNSDWYMKQLQSDLQQKRQVGMRVELWASWPSWFCAVLQVSVSLASMPCPPWYLVLTSMPCLPWYLVLTFMLFPQVWSTLPFYLSLQVCVPRFYAVPRAGGAFNLS